MFRFYSIHIHNLNLIWDDHAKKEIKERPVTDGILAETEEEFLTNYPDYSIEQGFAMTRAMARKFVINIVISSQMSIVNTYLFVYYIFFMLSIVNTYLFLYFLLKEPHLHMPWLYLDKEMVKSLCGRNEFQVCKHWLAIACRETFFDLEKSPNDEWFRTFIGRHT